MLIDTEQDIEFPDPFMGDIKIYAAPNGANGLFYSNGFYKNCAATRLKTF
jgi:hypothetical protein